MVVKKKAAKKVAGPVKRDLTAQSLRMVKKLVNMQGGRILNLETRHNNQWRVQNKLQTQMASLARRIAAIEAALAPVVVDGGSIHTMPDIPQFDPGDRDQSIDSEENDTEHPGHPSRHG